MLPNRPLDGTPTSTGTSPPARRASVGAVVRVAIGVVVLASIAFAVIQQWRGFEEQAGAQGSTTRQILASIDLRWSPIAASGIVVLGTYALLIATWSRMLAAWGDRIDFGTAARIWFVSNLGRYVPGKVWGIAAMARMSRDVAVSPAAAAGSAVLNTIVNIATGIAIALIAGREWLETYDPGLVTIARVLAVSSVAGLLALPWAMPLLTRLASRATGKDFSAARVPAGAIAIAMVGNVAAWILYGWAFQLLVIGVLGSASGSFWSYVAIWAASYVAGYLVLFVPGGLGTREGVLLVSLPKLAVAANLPQALAISVISRAWLTVLELVPGFLFYFLAPRPVSNEDSTRR